MNADAAECFVDFSLKPSGETRRDWDEPRVDRVEKKVNWVIPKEGLRFESVDRVELRRSEEESERRRVTKTLVHLILSASGVIGRRAESDLSSLRSRAPNPRHGIEIMSLHFSREGD